VPEGDCLFCRIAGGEIETERLHDDDQVVAFRDLNPQAPTHVLLIPRRHIGSALELTVEHGTLLARLFAAAAAIARAEGVADSGFRLVTNAGRDAGQSVDHLHFHLLGGRRLGWPPG
jgi:histidine triad (HIT) family protein